MKLSIVLQSISKKYNNIPVFQNLNWEITGNGCYVVAGPNGSGKTTLLKIMAAVLKPTEGEVKMTVNGKLLRYHDLRRQIGLTTPELQFYDHLTALENLVFFAGMLGNPAPDEAADQQLVRVGLEKAAGHEVKTFSSGMKQRLRLAFTQLNQPLFLLLDEPSANLDEEGKQIVKNLISEQAERGINVLATSDPEEVQAFGPEILRLPFPD